MEMEIEGVYRIDPSGQVTRVVEQPAIQRPNGLAITPDDRKLYLVDSNPTKAAIAKFGPSIFSRTARSPIKPWCMTLRRAGAAMECAWT